jgi:hypothetical protein
LTRAASRKRGADDSGCASEEKRRRLGLSHGRERAPAAQISSCSPSSSWRYPTPCKMGCFEEEKHGLCLSRLDVASAFIATPVAALPSTPTATQNADLALTPTAISSAGHASRLIVITAAGPASPTSIRLLVPPRYRPHKRVSRFDAARDFEFRRLLDADHDSGR